MQEYKYSLGELEAMIPFERTVYIDLLTEWLEKQKEGIKRENG